MMNIELNKVGMAYRNGYEVGRLRSGGFIVHKDLMKLLLKGLLGEDNSNKKALLKALETEI
jgi:hypothetical protein